MTKNFKRWQLLLILAISIFSNIHAQKEYSISAIVKDSQNELLFGNALLLETKDSFLIKGAYITDGIFQVEKISLNSCLIKITSFGYRDTILEINNNLSSILNSHQNLISKS
jgi:hypothetical protein